MSLKKDSDPIVILTKTLLTSISEVMSSVEGIDTEREYFIEFGCYLYRTSPAIMELRMTQNRPPNAMEILRSLSAKVNVAKHLVRKCSTDGGSITDPELKIIIEQLEGVIRNIGQDLSSIPSSAFENHGYAEVAVRSLSREMRNARLRSSGIHVCETEEPKLENLPSEDLAEMEVLQHLVRDSSEESRTVSSAARSGDTPRLVDFLRGMYYSAQESDSQSQSLKSLSQVAEYIEPLYDTFFCPLTKRIMDDPVTIESGVTYERRAINDWFKKFEDYSTDTICPTTGKKLESRVLSTNLALKTTIDEWKERNEATRIKVARSALSLASSEIMVVKAMRDLQLLCKKKIYNKVQMCNVGIIPLLTRFMEHEDMKIRCEALETLRLLVEEHEEGKEIIAKTSAIATTIRNLSSDHPSERHVSVSFLLELSKSEQLCEKIGSVTGGILMLITIKYNKSSYASTAEKAGETLKNLEKFPKNIKCMAENGLLEPLLNNLIDGSEEMQMEMGNFLGELVLGHDTKTYVAERASVALIKMVHSGNSLTRKAALEALVQLSSHHPNSKILIDAGAVPVMVEEMFTRKIYNEPMDSKEESAMVLANILESGVDPDTLQSNPHGHTMASDYTIYNIIHMLKYSMPDELNESLIKILLSLMKWPKPAAGIVKVIKETGTSYTVIEFLNSAQEELNIASTKLLIKLSPYMGHTIAERLCKTRGQPESLIKKLETDRINEKHAVSVNLLGTLPHQNVTLNLTLLRQGTVPVILQRIHEIQRGETRTSRYVRAYLEGLVGILVRFTTTLYDHDILHLAREQNLASVFTQLLMRTTGSDEVQRLSAVGLENLSSESINLSKPPVQVKVRKPRLNRFLSRCFTMDPPKERKLHLCPVHRGACSPSTTFCLLESRAVERLLGCLEHENVKVVEAALSAICTLLDDRVDVDRSISVLSEVNAVQHVLDVLREHKEEGLWQKSFWVIERFLTRGGDSSARDISNDRMLPSVLVSAFHHGDSNTRQVAENILKHLNKMPNLSRNSVSS